MRNGLLGKPQTFKAESKECDNREFSFCISPCAIQGSGIYILNIKMLSFKVTWNTFLTGFGYKKTSNVLSDFLAEKPLHFIKRCVILYASEGTDNYL